jgi:hypothetical protein
VRLVVGDPLAVVDAAVQGDVDAEGEEAHGGEFIPPPAAGVMRCVLHDWSDPT